MLSIQAFEWTFVAMIQNARLPMQIDVGLVMLFTSRDDDHVSNHATTSKRPT